MRSTLSATVLLALIGTGLAGADYFLKERTRASEVDVEQPIDEMPIEGMSSSSAMSESKPSIIKKGSSTQKKSGPDPSAIFQSMDLTPEETNEKSLIGLAAAGLAEAESVVLLRDNDRAFFFSHIQSGNVKKILGALKLALQEEFSADLKDLVDETRTPDDGPPVDYLSFLDPAISSERIVFLRVRDRLFELHIAENGQSMIDDLLADLSK